MANKPLRGLSARPAGAKRKRIRALFNVDAREVLRTLPHPVTNLYGGLIFGREISPCNGWDDAVVESFFGTLITGLCVTGRPVVIPPFGYFSPVEFQERVAHSTSGIHETGGSPKSHFF
jgi:hypothetical protein